MRALSHFYKLDTGETDFDLIVSMPYAGFKSFLQKQILANTTKEMCVNALCGL